jgi:ATP-dependent Clp protease ATP-binding subunit ClpA
MESVPVELDTLTRNIMRLEIEKEAIKKEKDDISKNRIIEIDNKLNTLKEKENNLRLLKNIFLHLIYILNVYHRRYLCNLLFINAMLDN